MSMNIAGLAREPYNMEWIVSLVEARAGKIDVQDASRLSNILMLIGRMIEGSDLERRLEALEAGER